MVDSNSSPELGKVQELSLKYEANRADATLKLSYYLSFVTAAATGAVLAGFLFAWSYYRSSIDTVEKLKYEVDDKKNQLLLLERQLEENVRSIDALRGNLKAWSSVTQLAPKDKPTGATGPVSCEDGFYVSGVNIVRDSPGINGIQLVCHKINVDR